MEDFDSELATSAKRYWTDDGYADGGFIKEVDYAAQAGGLHPLFQGIKIVDCDTHFTEPPDMFTSRAPAKFKDKMPYIAAVDGVDRWFVEGRDFGIMGGNVIRKDNNKLLGRLAFRSLADAHPGGNQIKERLKFMDETGVYAHMCYQNSGVTQAGSLMSLDDNERAIEIIKIYNTTAAERQEESGQRLFTLAHLPIWDKAALESEARRCIDMGLKGFVLPDTPEQVGMPSYNSDYWTPFLEMCEATGTPLNFHLNAAVDPDRMVWGDFPFEKKLSVVAMMFSMCNAATMGNWMVSGRLDQFPKLKIGLIESGMGWVPFALEALEHQFDEMLPDAGKLLQRRPWQYWRDHFWTTFWFEKVGPQTQMDVIGSDKLLFETDFPHPTSLYPGVQDHLVAALGDFPYEVRKQVLQTNASKLYNLPF